MNGRISDPHCILFTRISNLFSDLNSWSSNQGDLGSIPAKGVVSGSRPHQVLETKGKTGQLEVTAALKTSGSYLIGGFGTISDTLPINLVNDASITPDQVKKIYETKNYT